MIGRLRGVVAETTEEEAVIDVGGVGYVVRCGTRTLARLPAVGEETVIHVETQWSEQHGPRLYGFLAREDQSAFLALQAIQGVGPKAALAILDVLTPGELARAAADGDKAAVARASGVGPKLAARVVAELKGAPLADGPFVPSAAPVHAAPSASGEAVAALMGLGVAEAQARRVVDRAAAELGDGAEVQVLIKAGLKELGR